MSEWKIEIKKDGYWPFKWTWNVERAGPNYSVDYRMGEALTKRGAHKKAAKARISMERDDVVIRD